MSGTPCGARWGRATGERMTMRLVLPLLLLAGVGPTASAALIPYYRMDSLAFQSTDVILCDEGKAVKVTKTGSGGFQYECHDVTFTVVKALKGSLKAKEKITVELELVYTRRLAGDAFGEPGAKRPALPKGRALLFLEGKNGTVWRPVLGGVKLILNNEVYCHGQFVSNPGPLWLARMAPENVAVDPRQPYGEGALLKDVEAALKKSKDLTRPVRLSALDPSIVRPEKEGK